LKASNVEKFINWVVKIL